MFLANIDPELQSHVIDQVGSPEAIVLDTMNFWIENKFDELMKVIGRVHMLVINEAELREISKEHNLVKGAGKIMELGPSCIIAKRGEYGVLMVSKDEIFLCPAFPLEDVFDPYRCGRYLCRRVHGLPCQHGRHVTGDDQTGHHHGRPHGLLQRGGLQHQPHQGPEV
ncbi:MAG: PfkB family carbohydrate kinase [Desulfobacterales bacterium]|nr:PfkB family carbohydrate kinase [Desulfobacterales bacterium]